MGGLAWALKTLPVGVAYGVWVGIGAALTAVLAIVFFGESVSVLKIVSLVLIVAGVVGLNLSGGRALMAGRDRQGRAPSRRARRRRATLMLREGRVR